MKKIKIGLLVDDRSQSYLCWALFEKLIKNENVDLYLIINEYSKIGGARQFVAKLKRALSLGNITSGIRLVLFVLIDKLESIVFRQMPKYKDFFIKKRIDWIGDSKKLYVNPLVTPSGIYWSYGRSDIENIKNLALDGIVRFGGGILRGEILNSSKNGVISLHHGDNEKNRGGPAGFWEVYYKQDFTGFIIQKLSEELDGGEIIVKGRIHTVPLYKYNSIRILMKSLEFLYDVVLKLNDEVVIRDFKRPYYHKLYKVPTVSELFLYVLKTYGRILRNIFLRLIGIRDVWGVAYQYTKDVFGFSLRKSIKLKSIEDCFIADPVVVFRNNSHYIFVEEYSYSLKRACISVYEVSNKICKRLGVALCEKFHLSFPFIFEDGGQLYMVPESLGDKSIRLYRCVEFPLRWEYVKNLMSSINAVDTVVFKEGGKYWLLTSIDTSGNNEFCSELHIFYADCLMTDEWLPHRKNPIFTNANHARNAGFFNIGDGRKFRAFQSQGFDCYGRSCGVSEVVDIDENNYLEVEKFRIEPYFFDNIAGVHTLSFDNGLVAFDYLEYKKAR